MYINELNINEGKKHLEAKSKLFERIVDDNIIFLDQFQNKLYLSSWEFAAMESYVYKDIGIAEPYSSGYCTGCMPSPDSKLFNFSQEYYELISSDDFNGKIPEKDEVILEFYNRRMSRIFNRRFENSAEFNKNIYILVPENDITAFNSHPCNLCKYKNNIHIRFIFDIGLSHEGAYKTAIEIMNTSPVKKNKLDFCMKNDINLIEINANDILNLNDGDKYLNCRRLWYMTDEESGGCKIYI
jgi:hypothetical protein